MQAYTSPEAGSDGTPAMGPIINPIRLSSYSGISVTTKKGGDAWTGTQPGQQRGKSATKPRISEPAEPSDEISNPKKGKARPKKKPNQNRRRPNDPSAEQSMPKPSTPSIPVPARSEAPGTRQARRK
ncbi:hypothetical protein M407DRAFT_23904 [Tulasnella calospora MUT 4182]|uniref:Uncharacterized protein n=1 Tax=Tulasnella calospora MUT 4182 TaxID=1051891 RepID=A0A0C3QKE4_9AGAM|nr:hypothetical protein M407DRAFT_23904 [Tulasnella calospora MUT 4182]